MSLDLLFLTFCISHKKDENYGIHTSPNEDEDWGQDKHLFSETFEIQYMSWQLSLEKNSFLEVENLISDAFRLF